MWADGVLISEVVHICCLLDIMLFIHCFSERGRTRRCTGIPERDGSHIIIESSPHLPGATIVSACLSPGSSPGRRCTAGAALPYGCANCYGTRERKSRLPPRAVETILRAGIALQPRLAPHAKFGLSGISMPRARGGGVFFQPVYDFRHLAELAFREPLAQADGGVRPQHRQGRLRPGR